MKKNIIKLLSKKSISSNYSFRVSGQFEKLSAIYVTLSTQDPISPSKIKNYTNIITVNEYHANLVKNISNFVRPVVIASSKDQLVRFVKEQEKVLNKVDFYYYIIPHDDIWVRDSGPEWIVSEKEKKQIVINHNFALWGYIGI
jgi:agmatine/peptidylarginine deiminase